MTQRYDTYKDSGVQWLGEIPGHWGCVRLKNVCTGFSNGTTTDQVDFLEGTVPVTRIETISKGIINYEKVGHVQYSNNLLSYRLQIGDILFSHINSYERVGNCALYEGEHPLYHGMNLMRITPISKFAHYKFIHYYLISPLFLKQVQLKCKPAINQVSIPGKYVKKLRLNLPPLPEQHAIVSYLDDKCGKIDEWIEKKQKEVELLGEMKQRVIADAVTRGLNPDVKMKATNIAWLPEVPEHWEVKTLRNFLTMYAEKGHGDKQLLSVTREQGVIVRNTESKEENHNFIPEDLSNYKYVQVGDFVINKMKSWQGSYGVSEHEGIVSPAYFTCKLMGVDKGFFSTAIRSKVYISFFGRYSKGIRVDQWDLSPIALKSIPFLLPPLEEQKQIVAHTNDKTSKIDKLIANINKEIEGIKEYKQRLISDVVTGQIKVC